MCAGQRRNSASQPQIDLHAQDRSCALPPCAAELPTYAPRLPNSELVGHLLVNRNQEELAKVQAMADQLVADHYHIPRREPACAQVRAFAKAAAATPRGGPIPLTHPST